MNPWQTTITLLVIFLLSLGGCARLPENIDRSPSYAYTKQEETTIGKTVADELGAHPGESAYMLLENGLDAFVARAALAHSAEQSIDVQYYLLHNDKVGALFIDALIKAADRGVRVRLLIDDMDMKDRDFGTAVLDSHPNIEVRLFNPFGRNVGRFFQFVTGFGKQTRRSHNKSFTVDNVATIVGGRNIGDEYFVADPAMAFLDLDVLAIGSVAQEVSASFDQYWNHELSYPISILVEEKPTPEQINEKKELFDEFIASQADSIYLKNLKESKLAEIIRKNEQEFFWGRGRVVADDPEKLLRHTDDTTYHLSEELGPILRNTAKELVILSPYFVPGEPGIAFCRELRIRGVRIKVLTNALSSTDVPIVHGGYANYRHALLKLGVELYELNRNLGKVELKKKRENPFYGSKASLHAKLFVIDREKIFIGSLNLDARSVIQNTEIGVVLESAEIATELAANFDEDINKAAFRLELETDEDGSDRVIWHGLVDGEEKTYYSEPYSSFWERFVLGFMRLLPVESQI